MTDAKSCRSTFQADEKSRDRFLNKGIIAKYEDIALMDCYKKCQIMMKCESFSVNEKGKECHLSKHRRDNVNAELYLERKGFVYYERV